MKPYDKFCIIALILVACAFTGIICATKMERETSNLMKQFEYIDTQIRELKAKQDIQSQAIANNIYMQPSSITQIPVEVVLWPDADEYPKGVIVKNGKFYMKQYKAYWEEVKCDR